MRAQINVSSDDDSKATEKRKYPLLAKVYNIGLDKLFIQMSLLEIIGKEWPPIIMVDSQHTSER